MKKSQIKSYCKINLFLRVTKKLNSGKHIIKSFGGRGGNSSLLGLKFKCVKCNSKEVDISRFSTFHNSPSYLKDRIKERVGSVYDMHWPHLQPKTARNIRKSPLHSHHEKNRACFGEHAGWERPNWYAPSGIEPKMEYSYGKQNWFGT